MVVVLDNIQVAQELGESYQIIFLVLVEHDNQRIEKIDLNLRKGVLRVLLLLLNS